MKRYRVWVTHPIPDEGLAILRPFCELEVGDFKRALTKEEFLKNISGKEGVLTFLSDIIDGKVMEASKGKLRVISNYAAGVNNIDIQEATRRGIMVTNTPDVLTETTADFVFALLLAVARRVVEADAFVRSGKFQGWDPFLLLGDDVYGKRLGIVGLGRIGKAVARRALGFSMTVWYYSRTPIPEEEENRLGLCYAPLTELLRWADFVSLHVPLTPATYHLIGEKELRMMKPNAYLINTSRGPVIDEKVLVQALREGWIRGAALDVFEREPEAEKELLTLSNVVLAPHIGSASIATRTKMAVMAAENLLQALQGEIPSYLVNPEVLQRRKNHDE
ncbi:MAG: 2-hydroxyacid dehydrogenase [Candidatus Caldatribacteriaceae bacterium]